MQGLIPEITTGFETENLDSVILYSASVPIFFEIPSMISGNTFSLRSEQMCNFNLTGGPIPHFNKEGKKIMSGGTDCVVLQKLFDLVQTKRKFVEFLEGEEQIVTKRNMQLGAEPGRLGRENILQIISGDLSASASRFISAKEAQRVKFGSYIKLNSKFSEMLNVGLINLKDQLDNIMAVYDLLQSNYGCGIIHLIANDLIQAELVTQDYQIAAHLLSQGIRDNCRNRQLSASFAPRRTGEGTQRAGD